MQFVDGIGGATSRWGLKNAPSRVVMLPDLDNLNFLHHVVELKVESMGAAVHHLHMVATAGSTHGICRWFSPGHLLVVSRARGWGRMVYT